MNSIDGLKLRISVWRLFVGPSLLMATLSLLLIKNNAFALYGIWETLFVLSILMGGFTSYLAYKSIQDDSLTLIKELKEQSQAPDTERLKAENEKIIRETEEAPQIS